MKDETILTLAEAIMALAKAISDLPRDPLQGIKVSRPYPLPQQPFTPYMPPPYQPYLCPSSISGKDHQ